MLVRFGCAAVAIALGSAAAGPPIVPLFPFGQGPRVTGRIATDEAVPLASAAVVMRSLEGDGTTVLSAKDVRLQADGTFEFQNVPPGRYEIRARATTFERRSLFAVFRITVADREVTDLQLRLVPAASLSGTIVVDPGKAPPPALDGLLVRAPLADGSGDRDAAIGAVLPDGAFSVSGLMSGTHLLAIEGLPDPWVLASVTHRGRDITDSGLMVESRDEVRGVVVTLSSVATELTGLVLDASGSGVADAVVVVMPPGSQRWNPANRRMRLARADRSGRYRLRGLPPGEYRVAATRGDEAIVFDGGTLEALLSGASAASLGAGEARAVDIRIAGKPPQPAAR